MPEPRTLKLMRYVCLAVLLASIGSCVAIAAAESEGLAAVTVTALPDTKEPADGGVPFLNRQEAAPDYELDVVTTGRWLTVKAGAKPNQSAKDGLRWALADPVNVSEVASVRLRERDRVMHDAVAEAQLAGDAATANGYRFEFERTRSFKLGLHAFFGTPVGKAISAAIFLAALFFLLSFLS